MSNSVKRFLLGELWNYGKNESWYSYMAARGLHLQSVGNWFVTFEKGEPKKTRYRIEILQEAPSQEQLDVYSACGWKLVTSKQFFYIFSSPEESNAPELHTDPIEQSFVFQVLNKKLKRDVIIIALAVIFLLGIICSRLFLDKEPYLNATRRGYITLIIMFFIYVYILFEAIRGYVTIKKIRDSLLAGIPINHNRNWRLSHTISSAVYIILILIILTIILMPFYTAIKRDIYTASEVYQNFPIISINEIENKPVLDYYHNVDYNWSVLSPVQYSIYEDGYIEGEMQEDYSGAYYHTGIHVRYYELAFKSMVKGFTEDLIRRYYDNYRYGSIEKIEDSGNFEYMYAASEENSKLIFASAGNKVVFIKYFGNEDVKTVISLLKSKLGLKK